MDFEKMLRGGTVSLCETCAATTVDKPGLPEAERLSGFGDCVLCGEPSWKDGHYNTRVHHYRPRTAVERIKAVMA